MITHHSSFFSDEGLFNGSFRRTLSIPSMSKVKRSSLLSVSAARATRKITSMPSTRKQSMMRHARESGSAVENSVRNHEEAYLSSKVVGYVRLTTSDRLNHAAF